MKKSIVIFLLGTLCWACVALYGACRVDAVMKARDGFYVQGPVLEVSSRGTILFGRTLWER